MTVELNEKETNLLLEGLGELPAKKSMELIIKLRMMWHEQMEGQSQPLVNENSK